MALSLRDCTFAGPALPEPFVKFELERHLKKLSPLPVRRGADDKALAARWTTLRRKLRRLGEQGGDLRVHNHVIEPLAPLLGYPRAERAEKVRTREGDEHGGWWLSAEDGSAGLRAWTVAAGTDLDAPTRRGRAYRFSPSRVAARVLLAQGERAGLLTDGVELRLLICDPARPDSHISIALDRGGWRGTRDVADSFRLLLALACPSGVAALPDLVEAARLSQTTVTKKLRQQAREAVRGFVQGVLDDPRNRDWWERQDSPQQTARTLWNEGLVLVYRLLFLFKMESSADPARAFSFATTSLWRNSYSPNTALAPVVRAVVDRGEETGGFLEASLRTLFRLFADGMASSELRVSPLGGALFGAGTTPTLDALTWGERSVARLLDALLWTPGGKRSERERVHYGSLDVEDLGRVYEALLELEPGVTTEAMCRLRRAKLEVVVPASQGDPYRPADGEKAAKSSKAKVEWVEDIPAGRFFLRTGLGRKSSGSYYTPHPFVRFLVQETLGPQVAERSPPSDPRPARILDLKVLDPAMGSGHFLVEACRFLGDALYEACRLCDELASTAEDRDDEARAAELRARVEALPDPNDELLAWLPSRAPEGSTAGLSQKRAEALCRRLVAVHCLYGVDKNALAVELAKLSLWLESYAEGLPLTFMNHRLVCGDSLTGPFVEHLLTWPKAGDEIGEDLLSVGLREKLEGVLAEALARVGDLTASVGKDVADLELKAEAKRALDEALEPFRRLAAAWSGGVMLGDDADDGAYLRALKSVAEGEPWPERAALERMVEVGEEGVPYDLVFPEVFHPDGRLERTGGFDAVVGNPPWEAIRRTDDQFFGAIDFQALAGATKKEKKQVQERLLERPDVRSQYEQYVAGFQAQDRVADRLFEVHQARVNGNLAGRGTYDAYMLMSERAARLLAAGGRVGVVLPSAFHANEGATGLRRLFLDDLALTCCFSFENRKKLFEIDSRFKFAAVVAANTSEPTSRFQCAFYLHDLDWLFKQPDPLSYSRDFVRRTGGEYLSFLELRSDADRGVAETCFRRSRPFGRHLKTLKMKMSQEVNMTYDSHRFSDTEQVEADDPREAKASARLNSEGWYLLHEGKTFHQFDDRWGERPRYLVHRSTVTDKKPWTTAARHYRLAFRDIARSTDERTGIFCLLPAGVLCSNKAPVEREPHRRASAGALVTLALVNTFSFDWGLRTKVQVTVNLFILNGIAVPRFQPSAEPFLVHSALRLTCNHAGYAALWSEQLGDSWREPTPPHTWPVLEGDDTRWAVRAAIDAVVADAYGLSRDQYAHVLASFSHTSYPGAPDLCLAAFDELKAIGLDAYIQAHDPYHDVPLVKTRPKPVIDLSGAPRPPASADGEPAPAWAALTANDRSVRLLVLLLDAARGRDALDDVGAVKAEKFLHLAEGHVGIDLEREPQQLAAGPIDKNRQIKVFHRARMQNIFDAQKVMDSYRFVLGRGFEGALAKARESFEGKSDELANLAGLFAAADTRQAEILATLYAAWNDLLAEGKPADDDAIVAAFYGWHAEKSKHAESRLRDALVFMRDKGLVPTGEARRTRAQVVRGGSSL